MDDCGTESSLAEKGLVIAYLDYDGVLHHDDVYWSRKKGIHMRAPGATLFEWAYILEQLLAPFPEVRIVLSTSWVRVKSFDFAQKQLPRGLRERVVGATFHRREMSKFAFDQMARGAQIYADVQRRRPAGWIAIDNDAEGWPIHCQDNLIRTEDALGLSDLRVQAAIRERLAVLVSGIANKSPGISRGSLHVER
ncbi:hypothetical protein FHW58_003680 [Duganella sp. 1224]|uniref:HAD domain-containing protein n=1 Tax=Duganella sp. 1224 TaxID=2587052 RepID=UPI0015CAC2DF|nr:HAD domain-containing protein [Duganella sp. 1224]NYE62465.1 hypothetical protein [Duganella sp. 1224]